MFTEQQLDDLIGNRRRKYRVRRRTLEAIYFETAKDIHRDRIDPRHVRGRGGAISDVSAALAILNTREKQTVLGLAVGHTHGELAKSARKPIGSIKTLAHRARKKMSAWSDPAPSTGSQ